jgi:hypothetical protein
MAAKPLRRAQRKKKARAKNKGDEDRPLVPNTELAKQQARRLAHRRGAAVVGARPRYGW